MKIAVRTTERVGFIGQTQSGKTTLMRWLPDQAGPPRRLLFADKAEADNAACAGRLRYPDHHDAEPLMIALYRLCMNRGQIPPDSALQNDRSPPPPPTTRSAAPLHALLF